MELLYEICATKRKWAKRLGLTLCNVFLRNGTSIFGIYMISRVFWYQIHTYSSRFTVGIMGLYVKRFGVFLTVLVLFTSLIHSPYAVD